MNILENIPRDHDARHLVFMAIVVVVLFGVQLWLWGNVFDAASEFRNRQTAQEQLANVQQLTEDIRTVDGSQQALVDQAAVAFPLPGTVPHAVERVEALAEAQGLTLELQSIGEQKVPLEKSGLTPFDLNLVLVGSPRSLLAFLDAAEHMQELTRVESWKMAPVLVAGQTFGGKVYILTMKIRFFLQSE